MHTFYENCHSGRVKSQEIPRLTFVQASITELNTGKPQLSRHCVIICTVKLLTVFIPRDLWFWVAFGVAGQ